MLRLLRNRRRPPTRPAALADLRPCRGGEDQKRGAASAYWRNCARGACRTLAVIDRLDRAAVIGLDAAAFLDPFDAGARQALFQVERGVGVGVGAGRIVDRNRRLAGGGIERNLAQRHFQVGRSVRPRVNLARAHDRPGGDLRRGEIGFGDMFVHRCTPEFSCSRMASTTCARVVVAGYSVAVR